MIISARFANMVLRILNRLDKSGSEDFVYRNFTFRIFSCMVQ